MAGGFGIGPHKFLRGGAKLGGSGALLSAAHKVAGTGEVLYQEVSSAVLSAAHQLLGYGAVVNPGDRVGYGAVRMAAAQLSGQGTVTITGSGAVLMAAAQVTGSGSMFGPASGVLAWEGLVGGAQLEHMRGVAQVEGLKGTAELEGMKGSAEL